MAGRSGTLPSASAGLPRIEVSAARHLSQPLSGIESSRREAKDPATAAATNELQPKPSSLLGQASSAMRSSPGRLANCRLTR